MILNITNIYLCFIQMNIVNRYINIYVDILNYNFSYINIKAGFCRFITFLCKTASNNYFHYGLICFMLYYFNS